MYELFIKIMYERDFRKYTIQELEEMKSILNQFNKEVLEVKLKRVREEEDVSTMGEEKTDGGSRLSL